MRGLRSASIVILVIGCSGDSPPTPPPGDGPPPDAGRIWIDRCEALAATYAAPALPSAALRTLYVDGQAGDDVRSGTSPGEAWKTLGKANAAVRAGDHVLVSGTFTDQQINPAASGTATDPIVYRAADPSAVPTITTTQSAIFLASRSYIVVDGFAFVQDGGADPLYLSSSHHNWIRNVAFTKTGTSRMFGSADNRIEDCTFDGFAEPMMYARDGNDRNVIARNVFKNAEISWGMGALDAAPSRDSVFFGNELENRRGGSLEIAGLVPGTLVACNTFHHAGADKPPGMQGPNQPDSGSGPALALRASNVTIRFNVFRDIAYEVIRMQAYGDCTDPARVTHVSDNVVEHNTFYGNGGPAMRLMNAGPGPSGCGGATPQWANTSRNRLENNVFWDHSKFCDFHFCDVSNDRVYAVVFGFYHSERDTWPNGATGLDGNVLRNNLIGRDASSAGTPWMFWEGYTTAGARSYTLAEAQAAFPTEIVGNSEADPRFDDPAAGSLRPVPGSPAIDFATKLPGMTFEGAAPEVGRYELVP